MTKLGADLTRSIQENYPGFFRGDAASLAGIIGEISVVMGGVFAFAEVKFGQEASATAAAVFLSKIAQNKSQIEDLSEKISCNRGHTWGNA